MEEENSQTIKIIKDISNFGKLLKNNEILYGSSIIMNDINDY